MLQWTERKTKGFCDYYFVKELKQLIWSNFVIVKSIDIELTKLLLCRKIPHE